MINNERGSTLLVVMLMILIFTILGLSIISTSIGGAKRTEVREEQITNDLDSIRTLGEAVAYIKSIIEADFNDIETGNPDMTIDEYNKIIQEKMIGNSYGYQIQDISKSPEYKIEDKVDYTRVLLISSGDYKQVVYLTGMPSFLKYAVGTRGTLTLNGSTYVEEGNIYANQGLTLTNQAKYIYKGNKYIQETSLPSVANPDESILFMGDNHSIELCNRNESDCYNIVGEEFEKNVGQFRSLATGELEKGFTPYPPLFSREEPEFVDVDIEKTFKEKLKAAGFVGQNVDPLSLDINSIISNGIVSSSVQKITSFKEIDNNPSINGYLYIQPDQNSGEIYIDTEHLQTEKWIVIDGDAVIEKEFNLDNDDEDPLIVSANFLITGDLKIRGDVSFNSTIYVLGDTTVNNTNITGFNEGELILMTQGFLEIARINKFDENRNSIDAYLYTQRKADVYAVGSYLDITGGLFAYEGLEVNVFRGEVLEDFADFIGDKEPTASRLKVRNTPKLFIGKEQTFPKIDKLEVIPELMTK